MRSQVRSLALKFYDEQIPEGWEKLKEIIKKYPKSKAYIVAIKHDADPATDDIWGDSMKKPHYHVYYLVRNDKHPHIETILKELGIVFREEIDKDLWDNRGVETIRNIENGSFSSCVLYATHETEKAHEDGKTVYDRKLLISNLTEQELDDIRAGYRRPSKNRRPTMSELEALDKEAFDLGTKFENYDKWYGNLSYPIRDSCHFKTIKESYARGVEEGARVKQTVTRLCVYIEGTHNVGKTYAAREALKEMNLDIVEVSDQQTGRFDDVKPWTDAILVDDDTLPKLLNIADNKITKLYRRNSNNPLFTGKYLIITGNNSFDDWISSCGNFSQENRNAIKSRFFVCKVKNSTTPQIDVISISKRGTIEEQKERIKMFEELKNTCEKIMLDYAKAKEKTSPKTDELKNKLYDAIAIAESNNDSNTTDKIMEIIRNLEIEKPPFLNTEWVKGRNKNMESNYSRYKEATEIIKKVNASKTRINEALAFSFPVKMGVSGSAGSSSPVSRSQKD